MADVSVINGADQSFVRGGLPAEERNRPAASPRDEQPADAEATRPAVADATDRSNEISPQPSENQAQGGVQQNRANTGDQTAGGADRQADSVFISAEAQSALQAGATAEPRQATVPDVAAGDAETPVLAGQATGTNAVATASRADDRGETRPTDAPAGANAAERPGASQASRPAEETTATAAAGAAEGPAQTNQNVRDENSNAEVNGGAETQSEQTRTLGQVVDVFA